MTDSLYANELIIKLCENLGWDYLIIRQEGSLKTLGRKCDELENSVLYQKSYQAFESIKLKNGGTIERTVKMVQYRGYAAKHDYARANANAWLIWKILMFVAFWIFELFSFTTLAQKSKGPSSWMAFAKGGDNQIIKTFFLMLVI